MMRTDLIFVLSGLLSLTLCNPHEYVLIRESMPWGKAQNYCRENHMDLATVQSAEDWTTLQELADEEKFRSFSWIGLYNDINSWRWSYQEESVEFQFWYPGEPDNYGAGECVSIDLGYLGYWYDRTCYESRYFVCIDERTNAREKLVFIQTLMTWLGAQKYCRQHHTDLATVRSAEDNRRIINMINSTYNPWIGLYRDSWKWSDQANFTSSTQLTAQSLNGERQNCAGVTYSNISIDGVTYSNTSIDDHYCDSSAPFYCSTVNRKRQLIRVQVEASEDADDATLSAIVLNKFQQMLGDQDITLTWRKQPNGKIFQKKNTTKTTPVY